MDQMETKEYLSEIPEEVRKEFETFLSLQKIFYDNKRYIHIDAPLTAYSVFVYEDGLREDIERLADAITGCLHSSSLKDRMESISFHVKHSVSYIWIPADGSSFSVSLNSYEKVDVYGSKGDYHITSTNKEYYKSIKLVFFYDGGVYIERNIGASTKLTPFTVHDLAKIRLFHKEKGYEIVVKLLEDVMTGNAFKDILCQMENRLIYKFPPISFNEISGKHTIEEVMLEKYAGKELIRKIKFNKTDLAVGYMIYKTYNRVNEASKAILLDIKNHTDMLFKIHDDYYNCKGWYDEQVFLTDVLCMHIIQYESKTSPDFDIADVDVHISILDYIIICRKAKDKVNLRFRSYKKLIEAHDEMCIKYQNKFVPDIAIPASSRFMKLRTMLPTDEFEWITTKRRILKEAAMMHHCVASYAKKINKDKCAIYSYVEPESGERYTIEFEKRRGKTDRYKIVQICGVCNASCSEKTKEYVNSFL